MGSTSRPWVALDDSGFRSLMAGILDAYRTVAPTVQGSTVALREISSADELPSGVTLAQEPGSCRLVPLGDGDHRRFAWAVGPDSAKGIQHPAQVELFRATVGPDGFELCAGGDHDDVPGQPSRPLAVVGLRPCDVAAVGVLGRVLDRDPGALVVAVNCTTPGGTCFCDSMGTGPVLEGDRVPVADLVLWERDGTDGCEYIVTHASERGEALLEPIAVSGCDETERSWAAGAAAVARAAMGRSLHTEGLAESLMTTLESRRWDEIAERCLSCGNCTMVCPTCFCSSIHDTSTPDGSVVSRTQRWDSCFSLEHSYVHGGSVRSGTSDRYRQWLTHKLSTWWGQFGESGCIGCGRCITWCPVGIDLVEEANALHAEAATTHAAATGAQGDAGTRTVSLPFADRGVPTVSDVLVRRRDSHAVEVGSG